MAPYPPLLVLSLLALPSLCLDASLEWKDNFDVFYVIYFGAKKRATPMQCLYFAVNADVLLKGTNMDHGFECHLSTNGASFEHKSFKDLDSRGFSSVDMTAITFCAENNIPVVLFNLSRALCGDQVGTLIDQSGRTS